jgi:hypothetical protein
MKKILFVLLIVIFSAVSASATMYSCRDKSGKLFVSDNLQSLPAECRGDKQQITYRDDPRAVNYVPAAKTPSGSGPEFEQAVREAEEDLQQKKALEDGLLQQAQQLAEQYQQAVIDRKNATRRWKYEGSRDAIRHAEEVMEATQSQKEQLLEELQNQKVSRRMEQEITDWLDKVGE